MSDRDTREQRGLAIAALFKIDRDGATGSLPRGFNRRSRLGASA